MLRSNQEEAAFTDSYLRPCFFLLLNPYGFRQLRRAASKHHDDIYLIIQGGALTSMR